MLACYYIFMEIECLLKIRRLAQIFKLSSNLVFMLENN